MMCLMLMRDRIPCFVLPARVGIRVALAKKLDSVNKCCVFFFFIRAQYFNNVVLVVLNAFGVSLIGFILYL